MVRFDRHESRVAEMSRRVRMPGRDAGASGRPQIAGPDAAWPGGPFASILALQQTAGNQAVAALLRPASAPWRLGHGNVKAAEARIEGRTKLRALAGVVIGVQLKADAGDGCTLTLVNRDTNETWSNSYPVYETASFLMPQAGTFRWSAESRCTVVSRAGPGSLTLPAVVDGVGTSDAFKPPARITVTIKDFHGNARCALELRDVATEPSWTSANSTGRKTA